MEYHISCINFKRTSATIADMLRLSMLACIALIICLLPAESRTYMVDDNGFADFKTIGKAVVAASNGDTVYIKPGVYNESFTLNKSLILTPLIGEKGDIILEGKGKDIGVKITADGCSIDGLIIKNFNKAGIDVLSSDNIINNIKFENDNPAILIESANRNLISNNVMTDCRGGVALKDSSNENTIKKNEIDGGLVSIYLDKADSNSILSNFLTGASLGIWLTNSTSTEVVGNDISSKTFGIWVTNSSIGKLADNRAAHSSWGIYLMNATGMGITNNSIKDVESGITLESSKDNAVIGCRVTNSSTAFNIGSSSNNTIDDNSITDAKDTAIDLGYSNNNVFTGNQISRGERGILIAYSSANSLRDNKLKDIRHGLYVDGESFEDYNNSIDESNEIDGKPITYICGKSGGLIQHRDLAHLTLAYCNDFIVRDNNISNDALALLGSNGNKILDNNIYKCYGGMFMLNSEGNLVDKNKISYGSFSGIFLVSSDSNILSENKAYKNDQMGISLLNSENNTIRDNSIDHNSDTGIWLNLSRDNKIFGNNVSSNPLGIQAIKSDGNSIYRNDFISNLRTGIFFNLSKNNRIFENNISKNPTGAQIIRSTGNEIYHNNFLGNKEHAEDKEGDNRWDLGNVTGGNYWSDHTAIGNPSTGWAKLIRGAKKDNYPFQDMNGWFKANESIRDKTKNNESIRNESASFVPLVSRR